MKDDRKKTRPCTREFVGIKIRWYYNRVGGFQFRVFAFFSPLNPNVSSKFLPTPFPLSLLWLLARRLESPFSLSSSMIYSLLPHAFPLFQENDSTFAPDLTRREGMILILIRFVVEWDKNMEFPPCPVYFSVHRWKTLALPSARTTAAVVEKLRFVRSRLDHVVPWWLWNWRSDARLKDREHADSNEQSGAGSCFE